VLGAVMLHSIRLECVGFSISTGFACKYIHTHLNTWELYFDFRKTRLMPVLPEANYCIICVVSLLTSLIEPYSKMEIKIILKCVPIYCTVSILQNGKRFVPHAKSSDQLS
jgi:hypothetical protein